MHNKKITNPTIAIADDHPIFRKGLREIIELANYTISYEAGSGKDALDCYEHYQPDIIILDISLGDMNGLNVAEEILCKNKQAKCIMMTMYKEESFCKKALSLGVKGYLLKDDAVESIIDCLSKVASGHTFLSESMRAVTTKVNDPMLEPEKILSEKELLILNAIAELKTNKEMAREFNISHRTVQNHRQNMSAKLELSGRQALLQYAVNWKELNLDG